MPYWKGDMETSVHAARHFQLERRELVKSGISAVVVGWVVEDGNECDGRCSMS
jgi:hypothetical protein